MGLNDIVPDSEGTLALTLGFPVYLQAEDSSIHLCGLPVNNLVSGWQAVSDHMYWLISNEGLGRFSLNDCSYITARPPIFLDRKVAVISDSSAFVTGITGKVYLARLDADSLLFKFVEGDVPIDGSQSVIGTYNGLAYVYSNTRTGQNVLLSAYDKTGQIVSSIDIRWANVSVSNWSSFILGRHLVTFNNTTNTINTIDLETSTVKKVVVVPLGVPKHTDVTLLGLTAAHAVFKVGTDRVSMLPIGTIVDVKDYPVKSVYFTNVYPNPSSDQLTIQLGRNVTADIAHSSLLITSTLGEVERRLDLNSLWNNSEFSATVQLQVSDLPCGPHLLVIKNRGYTESTLLQIVR